jgi:hypothetical protein
MHAAVHGGNAMKPDSTRIDETIAFISSNNSIKAIPMVRRQAVAQFCRQTYPKLSEVDLQSYSTTFHELSREMSVKRHATPGQAGDQTDRAKRRAIVLIWKSLGKAFKGNEEGDRPMLAAQAAMTLPTGVSLDDALADAIRKASVCADQTAAGNVFTADIAANVEQFIGLNRIDVHGLVTGAEKFSDMKRLTYDNVLDCYFQYNPVADVFVFSGIKSLDYGAAHVVKAVNVPAVNWYDVPGNGGEESPVTHGNANFAHILGCELTGASFMVTTQFTGCAFCWTQQNGVVRAAHIGPTRAGFPNPSLATSYKDGGPGLAQDIIAQVNDKTAGMANARGAPLYVFGREAGNIPVKGQVNPYYQLNPLARGHGTIIGFKAGGWSLYFQAVDYSGAIVDHRRIL